IGYHQGNPPDPRARSAGEKRGYSFAGMRARKVRDSDFEQFDLILAADRDNLLELQQRCPKQYQHKLALFLSYGHSDYDEIPDPYYGGENGFELVLDLIEDASEQLLLQLKQKGR
ncbi:low molecular weight protein-tyrosine-phosphatase, partial [Vibrio cholerae]